MHGSLSTAQLRTDRRCAEVRGMSRKEAGPRLTTSFCDPVVRPPAKQRPASFYAGLVLLVRSKSQVPSAQMPGRPRDHQLDPLAALPVRRLAVSVVGFRFVEELLNDWKARSSLGRDRWLVLGFACGCMHELPGRESI